MITKAIDILNTFLGDIPKRFTALSVTKMHHCAFSAVNYAEAANPFDEFVSPAMRALATSLGKDPIVFAIPQGPIGVKLTKHGICLHRYVTDKGVIVYQVGVL